MKTLKLAFAMGGGVSLGSFSGAALTESIKQLIARGGYLNENGEFKTYDRVELDVFSGSSAGAISLGILIRICIGYEDKIHLLAKLDKYEEIRHLQGDDFILAIKEVIRQQLEEEFPEVKLSSEKMEQLIILQIAQDFEALIWCEQADILAMSGTSPHRSLKNEGGLLDSQFLQKLAVTSFLPASKDSFKYCKQSILAKRVLFASSLTRLEPTVIDGGDPSFEESTFLQNRSTTANELYKSLVNTVLTQGVSSYTHKDLRVFDIDLSGQPKTIINQDHNYPTRWIYATQQQNYRDDEINALKANSDKPIYDLQDVEFWRTVTQTCIAAGAFPFAFEPVELPRNAHEINSSFEQSYHYIDGGTLNNEPIREAFRLSSFLDSQHCLEDGMNEFDRVVIYVDPFIGGNAKADSKRIRTVLSKKNQPSSQQILDTAPFILSALRNEGSIVEIDRALGVYDKFAGRKLLVDFYRHTLAQTPDQIASEEKKKTIHHQLHALYQYIKQQREFRQKESFIPASMLNIEAAIRRVITSSDQQDNFSVGLVEQLRQRCISHSPTVQKALRQFLYSKTPAEMFAAQYFKDWLLALYLVGLDVVTDLNDKDAGRTIIPIGPVQIDPADQSVTSIPLGGAAVEGFYGFLAEEIRDHDFKIGQIVTRNILKALEIIRTPAQALEKTSPLEILPDAAMKDNLHSVLKKRIKKDRLFLNYSPNWSSRTLIRLLTSLLFIYRLNAKNLLHWVRRNVNKTED
ncbi:MAG: patatin-like phospholipase family protein [Bacteroidota bacterium]